MDSNALILERFQFVKGIDPIADAHAGGVSSDVIDMAPFSRILFLSYKGVATGGTAACTYTVDACDDTTPSNTSAIAFYYRKGYAAPVLATATGFQTTAGSSLVDGIEVREDALAASGYRYIRLTIAETVNDPVVACVLVLGELKVARNAYNTVTD